MWLGVVRRIRLTSGTAHQLAVLDPHGATILSLEHVHHALPPHPEDSLSGMVRINQSIGHLKVQIREMSLTAWAGS